MKTLPIVFVSLILLSCGSAYHLKRAKFHIAKAESLGAEWKSDTVRETIYIDPPSFTADTVIVRDPSQTGEFIFLPSDTTGHTFGRSFDNTFDWGIDTLRLKEKGIDTKVKIGPDKVYIKTKCDPEIITKVVDKIIDNTIECPECVIKWWWLLIAFLFGAAAIWIANLFRKR